MEKIGIILALVACVSAKVKLGPCKNCDKSIDTCFGLVASAVKGMEPIVLNKQEICNVVNVTYASTLHRGGESCMATGDDKANYQTVGIALDKIHVECEIIQLEEFGKYVGLKIPKMPKIPLLTGNIKGKEAKRVIIVDWKKPQFKIQTRLDYDNDVYNVTKCEVIGSNWNALQISLKGDDLFVGLGQLLTKPVPVRAALGAVAQQVIKVVITKILQDPVLTEVITLLNCGDTSDIEDEDRK